MRLQKNCRRVLTAWLLLAGSAQAATLSGFVSDADNGEALTRVIVAVEGLQFRTVSNNSGYYAVVQVPAGTHVVSASHAGYQTWRDTLHFGADEAVRLDLTLVPKPTDMGEQVSVEAERISLRAKPLQQLPALGEADLLRGLQLLPGVQAVADISSGLYVRGGDPSQTAILLDDIPCTIPPTCSDSSRPSTQTPSRRSICTREPIPLRTAARSGRCSTCATARATASAPADAAA